MEQVVKLRWWTFSQNNSGGWFYENEDVHHYVAIQAASAREAVAIAEDIFSPYTAYCECCGERWSYWADESDGADVPEIYGTPYDKQYASWSREAIVLHYYDGRKETHTFPERPKELENEWI